MLNKDKQGHSLLFDSLDATLEEDVDRTIEHAVSEFDSFLDYSFEQTKLDSGLASYLYPQPKVTGAEEAIPSEEQHSLWEKALHFFRANLVNPTVYSSDMLRAYKPQVGAKQLTSSNGLVSLYCYGDNTGVRVLPSVSKLTVWEVLLCDITLVRKHGDPLELPLILLNSSLPLFMENESIQNIEGITLHDNYQYVPTQQFLVDLDNRSIPVWKLPGHANKKQPLPCHVTVQSGMLASLWETLEERFPEELHVPYHSVWFSLWVDGEKLKDTEKEVRFFLGKTEVFLLHVSPEALEPLQSLECSEFELRMSVEGRVIWTDSKIVEWNDEDNTSED